MAKIGEGVAAAYGRQGLAELRGVFYPDSQVPQHTDYGMWGVATPGEAAAARQGKDSTLEDRLKQAEASREDHGRDDRDKGMERE